MGEDLDLKLYGSRCDHSERLCEGVAYICKCKAPKEHSCRYKVIVSDNLVMCRKYDTAINKVLANTPNIQR